MLRVAIMTYNVMMDMQEAFVLEENLVLYGRGI